MQTDREEFKNMLKIMQDENAKLVGPSRYRRHVIWWYSTQETRVLKLSVGSGIVDMVSQMWYRIPFDQSELSVSKIPPTDSPKFRPGRDP